MYRDAFALAGRTLSPHSTQGDALGYVLVAPSWRALNAYAYSLIQLEKLEYGNYFWSLSIHPRVSPFLTFVPCLASTSTSFPPSAAGMVTSSSHGVRI